MCISINFYDTCLNLPSGDSIISQKRLEHHHQQAVVARDAAEEKNVSESLIREKLATLPEIKKEVHVWEKKYQVSFCCTTFREKIQCFILLKHNWE